MNRVPCTHPRNPRWPAGLVRRGRGRARQAGVVAQLAARASNDLFHTFESPSHEKQRKPLFVPQWILPVTKHLTSSLMTLGTWLVSMIRCRSAHPEEKRKAMELARVSVFKWWSCRAPMPHVWRLSAATLRRRTRIAIHHDCNNPECALQIRQCVWQNVQGPSFPDYGISD